MNIVFAVDLCTDIQYRGCDLRITTDSYILANERCVLFSTYYHNMPVTDI